MDIANQIISISKELEKKEEIYITSHITIEQRNSIQCDYIEYKIFNKEKTIKLSITGFENNIRESEVGSKVIVNVHHEIPKYHMEMLHDICFEYFKELIRDILSIYDNHNTPFIGVSMENDVTMDDVCIFGQTQTITKLWNNYIHDEDDYLEMSEKGFEKLFKYVWTYIKLSTTITEVETKTKTDEDTEYHQIENTDTEEEDDP
jgi:hypothetical protein